MILICNNEIGIYDIDEAYLKRFDWIKAICMKYREILLKNNETNT